MLIMQITSAQLDIFLENQLDSISAKSTHTENVKPRLRIDEQCIQDVISLISVWEYDPFDLQHQLLRSFQAGAYASKELIEDFVPIVMVRYLSKIQSRKDYLPNQNQYLINIPRTREKPLQPLEQILTQTRKVIKRWR